MARINLNLKQINKIMDRRTHDWRANPNKVFRRATNAILKARNAIIQEMSYDTKFANGKMISADQKKLIILTNPEIAHALNITPEQIKRITRWPVKQVKILANILGENTVEGYLNFADKLQKDMTIQQYGEFSTSRLNQAQELINSISDPNANMEDIKKLLDKSFEDYENEEYKTLTQNDVVVQNKLLDELSEKFDHKFKDLRELKAFLEYKDAGIQDEEIPAQNYVDFDNILDMLDRTEAIKAKEEFYEENKEDLRTIRDTKKYIKRRADKGQNVTRKTIDKITNAENRIKARTQSKHNPHISSSLNTNMNGQKKIKAENVVSPSAENMARQAFKKARRK